MSDQFGEYTVTALLSSEGDMGTTYRAEHPTATEPVALKILDKIDTSNPMKRDAGLEVLEFVMSLNHSRLQTIHKILDSPDGSGQFAIVMPLAAQRSLGDVMAGGHTLTPKQGFKMLGQLANGLQYLHGQEIAHGSVKPNNVLLDEEGNAALTDVSMAHLRELGFVPAQPTRQHLLFMPPEREYHAAPEMAGDVYSLAVLAYWLLSGKMPFEEPEPETRGIIPQNNLPAPILAVLRRAMNPHLRLRYPTLMELMTALKDASQGKVDTQTMKVFGTTTPPQNP